MVGMAEPLARAAAVACTRPALNYGRETPWVLASLPWNSPSTAPSLRSSRTSARASRPPCCAAATPCSETPDDATLVCNFVDATDARPYRRTNKWTFVASFWYAAEPPDDFVRTGYPVLLKALSNLSVCVVPDVMARFLTLEQGNYEVPVADAPDTFYDRVSSASRRSRSRTSVIENIWTPDLEPELWDGDEIDRRH